MAQNLSTFAIAKLLNVDAGSVANWIDKELLKAHRTPGGHRRVEVGNLVRFLQEHNMPVPPDLETKPICVLVVDDEDAVARLVARSIQERFPEYKVIEANDGFQAGTLIATSNPDVVVLDLRMPGLDGYEVCRMIKAREETRHAEVIAMTAYPSPENTNRIIDCGARVCLDKPLDMDVLMKEIEKSL